MPYTAPCTVSPLTWLVLITAAVGSALPAFQQLSTGQQPADAAAVQLAIRLATIAHEGSVRAQLASLQASQARSASDMAALTEKIDELTATLNTSPRFGQLPRTPHSQNLQSQSPTDKQVVRHTCDLQPSRLVAGVPHQKPAVPACAATCLQLRDQGGATEDGVYWLSGLPVPVFCDLSLDDGGWTLLLTAVSKPGWDALSVLSRNKRLPTLGDNYSILSHANTIRDFGKAERFAYRIETQAQVNRQRWGGVWLAPRGYSFVHNTNTQTDVLLVRRFNKWSYKDNGIEQRMPWVNMSPPSGDGTINAALTTSTRPSQNWWGTLVTHHTVTSFKHSPWISPEASESGTVLYWAREEAV